MFILADLWVAFPPTLNNVYRLRPKQHLIVTNLLYTVKINRPYTCTPGESIDKPCACFNVMLHFCCRLRLFISSKDQEFIMSQLRYVGTG